MCTRYYRFAFEKIVFMRKLAVIIAALLTVTAAPAQTAAGLPEQINSGAYDPQALFAPGFYGDWHLSTRTAGGAPSSTYWQNRANYTLSANLDTSTNQLAGSAVIQYINNSPDTLHTL